MTKKIYGLRIDADDDAIDAPEEPNGDGDGTSVVPLRSNDRPPPYRRVEVEVGEKFRGAVREGRGVSTVVALWGRVGREGGGGARENFAAVRVGLCRLVVAVGWWLLVAVDFGGGDGEGVPAVAIYRFRSAFSVLRRRLR